jgi:hypothetical protein
MAATTAAAQRRDTVSAPEGEASEAADTSGAITSRREFVGGVAAAVSFLTLSPDFNLVALEAASVAASNGTAPASYREWHQRGDLVGMIYLVFMRDWLRNSNLYDTEEPPLSPATVDPTDEQKKWRTLDGTYNDLKYPQMGSCGRRFGRNVPLPLTVPDPLLNDPNPRTVSRELLTRHQFQAASSLNVLAAAWIQFQVHDWFSHEPSSETHSIPIPAGDSWPHGSTMQFARTLRDGAPGGTRPPAYRNRNSHWWDASQLYGNTQTINDTVRTGAQGKVRVRSSGLLEIDANGQEITGSMPNGWFGVSLLHGLFAREHNAVCDELARKEGLTDDDELHHTARLIMAALLAKIHTLEWTTAVLATRLLDRAMNINWSGLGRWFWDIRGTFEGDEIVKGILHSPTDHHTAPYSLTEEFVSVYRMHPLMPDQFTFLSIANGETLATYQLADVLGAQGRMVLDQFESRLHDIFYSIGVSLPGAITLQNYPRALQDFKRDGRYVDLGTLEIVRDRERGVPRYNAFRRLLGKRPVTSFGELTSDRELARKLEAIYHDVDRIDAMIGMLAEKPPDGFAFSDTAFRIFLLMASRRLKSDRFFTQDYWNEKTYTHSGMCWIEQNSMATIIRRHFPALRDRIGRGDNAFKPWKPVKS